jgi:hypothetical protein
MSTSTPWITAVAPNALRTPRISTDAMLTPPDPAGLCPAYFSGWVPVRPCPSDLRPKRFLLAHDGERLLESKRVIVAPGGWPSRFCRAYATKVR